MDILRLHHLLETAELLATSQVSKCDEETLRDGLLRLLPSNIPSTLRSLLAAGRAKQALLVTQRCVRGVLPLEAAETVRLIPATCPTDEVVHWIRYGVVARLAVDSTTASSSLVGGLTITAELLRWAKQLEESTGSPFEALKLLSLARELATSTPCAADSSTTALVSDVHAMYRHLTLQKAVWEHWQDEIRLEEVVELGLRGIVFDRIDSVEESGLIVDIKGKVQSVVGQFGACLDELLRDWIQETISSKLVQAGGNEDTAQDADDGDKCTLSRLVLVAAAISDRSIQARMVLTLLQMPVLEDVSLQSTSPYSDLKSSVTPGNHQNESTRMLCELAATAMDYVDGATRDALTEATKLLKIKALAASYGVENFEPRNSKQVRAVVILIASSLHRLEAVRDAVEFASSWGSSSVDMSAVLTRAIVQRSTNAKVFSTQNSSFDEQLKRAIEYLPEELVQVVLEDSLIYLLDDLTDVSEEIVFQPETVASDAASTDAKRRAEMDVRAAVLLTSHYLDITRRDSGAASSSSATTTAASVDTTTASKERRIRFQEKRDEWINADLLARLKRIATLQISHGVYLCIADLDDNEVCQTIAVKLAKHRVQDLITETSSSAVAADKTSSISALDAHSRKACALLNVCPTFFTHTAMKLLVEASHTVSRLCCSFYLINLYSLVLYHVFICCVLRSWQWKSQSR